MTGEASATRFENANSMMLGSASSAAETSDSLGMKAMTSSGEASKPFQYPFEPSAVMCARTACTCCFMKSPRRAASAPLAVAGIWLASRYALKGTFASTAIDLPPGRRTTMSGRP